MTKPKATKPARRAKASALTQPAAPGAGKEKGWTLATPADLTGRTHNQFMAQVSADGLVGNARSLVAFGAASFGEFGCPD